MAALGRLMSHTVVCVHGVTVTAALARYGGIADRQFTTAHRTPERRLLGPNTRWFTPAQGDVSGFRCEPHLFDGLGPTRGGPE